MILDGFCWATGYERKHALRVLRWRKRISPNRRPPRTRRYGLEFRRALKLCWEATDYLCAERLQPFGVEQSPEFGRGRHGPHVAEGARITDWIALVIESCLGEETSKFDLSGVGAPIRGLPSQPCGFRGDSGHPGSIHGDVEQRD